MPCFLLVTSVTVVAMEAWAAWAHRVLWHGPLWRLHQSHHASDHGRGWQHNDLFSLAHAAAALALAAVALHLEGLPRQLLAGLASGALLYGMAYAVVHDGVIHRRLPLPAAIRRKLRPLAAAHRAHHRHGGAPYGLFSSPWLLKRARSRRRGRRRALG